MKSVFNGFIRIVQVLVAVKAYSILEDSSPKLEILHRGCRAPIERSGYTCTVCHQDVPAAETVKGTQYMGQYVLLEEEQLDDVKIKIEPEHRALDVDRFIRLNEINPLWLDATYYLLPMHISVLRSYAVFSNALRVEKVGAVVQYQSHGRHHLGIIRWTEPGLLLHTLHFAQNIRDIDEPSGVEHVTLTAGETKLARQLIQKMTKKFEYEKYRDTTEDALWDLIKTQSKKRAGSPAIPDHTPASDALVDELRRSLKNGRGKPSRKSA
jgi:DNA end-binding protein Ku